MHSIPSVSVHPNGKWLCGQSMDNQIVTYSALDRFRINRKKVFKGHTSSGYACQVSTLRSIVSSVISCSLQLYASSTTA
jgi:pre-mRNA-processing factor 17